jgi:hypothetical protein
MTQTGTEKKKKVRRLDSIYFFLTTTVTCHGTLTLLSVSEQASHGENGDLTSPFEARVEVPECV